MAASSKSELAALSRVFSPSLIRELGATGKSPLLSRLLTEAGIPQRLPSNATLADAYNLAYEILQKVGNRDDYVYRAAIIQKIVLGRHNLRTATALNEFRTGKSKADLVVLNGTATVYEIKSERDSFQRLNGQVSDYSSVFASVNVVTSPAQGDAALRAVPEEVGVLVLSPRFQFQVLREAADLPGNTSPTAILGTLRTGEAVSLLADLGISFPSVPNTRVRYELQNLFRDLNAESVHAGAVRVLRSSRSRANLEQFIQQLPRPLCAIALSIDLPATSRKNLTKATHLSLASVLAWN